MCHILSVNWNLGFLSWIVLQKWLNLFVFQILQTQADQLENKLVKEKMVKVLELCQFLIKTVHLQVGGMRSWEDKSYYGHRPDSLSASAVCRSCLWTWTPSRRPCSPWPAPPLWRARGSWRTRTGLWWSSSEWRTSFSILIHNPNELCTFPSDSISTHTPCFPVFHFKAFMITFYLFPTFPGSPKLIKRSQTRSRSRSQLSKRRKVFCQKRKNA